VAKVAATVKAGTFGGSSSLTRDAIVVPIEEPGVVALRRREGTGRSTTWLMQR
jgi:hypothetical protein